MDKKIAYNHTLITSPKTTFTAVSKANDGEVASISYVAYYSLETDSSIQVEYLI
jgi:hypothetical protein